MRRTPMSITCTCLAKVFFRTYFISAAFNPQGLQSIPFSYAVDPALQALYLDKAKLSEARLRYAQRYNCHPFFTPLLMGMALFIEQKIIKGQFPIEALERTKTVTTNSLSALGDSFFSGSLAGLWALASILLLIHENIIGFAALLTVSFCALQIFKAITFFLGYKYGISLLAFILRLNLINFAGRIKYLNSLLLALCICAIFPNGYNIYWVAGVTTIIVCCFFAVRHAFFRIGFFILLLGMSLAFPLH